tara:strand:- start:554 stop:1150 length:597 start_codon:yes stop_codon:yes gene_type:complete
MKKFLLLILFFIISSCFKSDIIQSQTANTDPASMHNGQVYPTSPRSYTSFCNAPKNCKFLFKYDGTVWADTENYYSDFSDIQFLNSGNFISFLKINKDISYCKGWKKGDNTFDGIKWNIKIKKDEWDEFWFDYDYYGTSNEIENSITYKYEVIDSLLYFSNTDGQEFIFHPSDKNYSKDFIDTGEILVSEGCTFYGLE